jgi:hypothetical protein
MESAILKSESFITKSGIDTLKLYKLFKEAGFTEQQAETLTRVLQLLNKKN